MNHRVLFCDNLSFWGGGEHWIVEVASALNARGWRTVVAGRRGSELVCRAGLAGLETQAWPYRRDFDWATISAANTYLRASRPDLVLLTTGRDLRTVGLAARHHRIPVIWRMGPKPRHNLIHRLTGRWVVDRVIAPSEFVRRDIEQFPWLRGRIEVIPNGIADVSPPTDVTIASARARLGWREDETVILYVGRLIPVKGVDVLLTAFVSLIADTAHARLVLVGTGSHEPRLREIVRENGIASSVEFAGYTTEPGPYLDACDLVVLPSYSETFSYVLLEAMARGKPVVATSAGAIPEVTGDDAARLVAPGDANALAVEIRALLADPDRRSRQIAAGRRRATMDFTKESMIDRIETVFDATITAGA